MGLVFSRKASVSARRRSLARRLGYYLATGADLKPVVYRSPVRGRGRGGPEPVIEEPGDALVRIITANVCGPGLRMIMVKVRGGQVASGRIYAATGAALAGRKIYGVSL